MRICLINLLFFTLPAYLFTNKVYVFLLEFSVGKKRNVKKDIVQAFGLAPEAVGCVRITAIDNTDIVIENHGRVAEYTSRKAAIDAGALYITVEGEGLSLESLGAENVDIKGSISAIRFEANNKVK